MLDNDRGVILQTYPHQNFFLVLAEKHGKIMLRLSSFCSTQKCHAGSLISFNFLKQKRTVFVVRECIILHQPDICSFKDIGWLHHLLEAGNFFVPLHQPIPHCFTFFHNSYALLALSKYKPDSWELEKLFCTATLYTLFGFFPPPFLVQQLMPFRQQLLSSLDFNNPATINFFTHLNTKTPTVCKHSIDFWLASCIQSHPQAHDFKTYTIQITKNSKSN